MQPRTHYQPPSPPPGPCHRQRQDCDIDNDEATPQHLGDTNDDLADGHQPPPLPPPPPPGHCLRQQQDDVDTENNDNDSDEDDEDDDGDTTKTCTTRLDDPDATASSVTGILMRINGSPFRQRRQRLGLLHLFFLISKELQLKCALEHVTHLVNLAVFLLKFAPFDPNTWFGSNSNPTLVNSTGTVKFVITDLEFDVFPGVIELNFPYTLSGELATVMQEPFPALTHLLIESDIWGAMPALPDSFLGGSAPRLQTISISGIPFPAAPTLFSSAHDLVKIDLSDIPPTGHIPPEAMVAGLAALPRLKFLTFEFEMRMPFSYPDRMRLLPITRTTLPALTTFYFKGLFEYFEDFVAQIDAPQLISLRIELCQLEDTGFQLPQLFKFFDRSEKFKLSRFIHTDIFMSNAVAIELDRHCWRSSFSITVPEKAMGQVVSQLSVMLSNVTRLFLHFNGAGDDIQWLEIFRPFTSVKALSVIGDLSYCVPLTLKNVTGERAAEVLPALELLYLENQPAKSVKKFVAARQKVGRPVAFIGEKRKFKERLNTLDVDE
ncbi:hypothetical protein EDB85DRAFT_2189791 [Lactarius pseudohatsudake]|nr:hypothetical protein EDB85DRAFT_2189791 [Lactarius pseudohatsudake]